MMIRTIIETIATIPVFATKSKNVRPAALPIIIFGGSPIRVAVPPMLAANI